jgi:hypothetical protein
LKAIEKDSAILSLGAFLGQHLGINPVDFLAIFTRKAWELDTLTLAGGTEARADKVAMSVKVGNGHVLSLDLAPAPSDMMQAEKGSFVTVQEMDLVLVVFDVDARVILGQVKFGAWVDSWLHGRPIVAAECVSLPAWQLVRLGTTIL